MASTYSDLKFELIGTGEQAGTWGATTNTNLGTAIEQAIAGKADITFSSTTETLTLTNTNAAQDARAIYLNLGGTPGGAATLEVPAIEKPYIVKNGTGETVTVKVSGQTGIVVPNGTTAWLYTNGTDVVRASDIDGLVPSQTGNSGKYLTTNGSAVSWATVTVAGDVVGPASATDNFIAVYDGTTGKLLKNGNVPVFVDQFLKLHSAGAASNVGVGGLSLNARTTGTANVSVGEASLFALTSGEANVCVGSNAGLSITTGQYNTCVGFDSGGGITTTNNSSCFGRNSAVTGADQVQLGNSSTTTYVYGTVQNRSDERDKADIRDTQLGLNFITALRPVDYKWDMREDYRTDKSQTLSELTHDNTHKRSRYHHGLIAQEVKQVMEAQGIDFGGYQDHKIKGGDDVLTLGYDELVAPMIKAIQELTTRLEAAEAEIAALKGQ